jgi:hypothetical protein
MANSDSKTPPWHANKHRWTRPLEQIPTRPGIEFLQDGPELLSETGRRVLNPHRHFREDLPFYKTILLKFSQLLRQYLLRDSRNALPQNFEPQWLFAVYKPPQDHWLPSAANQHQQFFNGALAGN